MAATERDVIRCKQTLIEAAGLGMPADPPLAHFSPGVKTRIAARDWRRRSPAILSRSA